MIQGITQRKARTFHVPSAKGPCRCGACVARGWEVLEKSSDDPSAHLFWCKHEMEHGSKSYVVSLLLQASAVAGMKSRSGLPGGFSC
mmetsp:Transcript_7106/g.43997  ORF Transcript_7106/g.43997 Transcript_7106/m.43997 type:complete len:87 (-) Transcript_7106:853-1113(-)